MLNRLCSFFNLPFFENNKIPLMHKLNLRETIITNEGGYRH